MSDSPVLRASRELYVSVLAGGAIDLDARVVESLAALLTEECVAAGHRICAEGEVLDHVYFMRQGRVRLERAGAASWTIEGTATLGAFETALGGRQTRSAIAMEDLLLMRLPAESWIALLDDNSDLARLTVVEGLRRLADLEAQRWARLPERRNEVGSRIDKARWPLGLVDRVTLLASMPVLRAAGVQVIADLAGMVRERTFERDEVVHARGVASARAFVVVEGEVRGKRSGPELQVAFAPGSLVCGAAWLGVPQLAWETRATTRTRTLVLDEEHWFDVMEEHTRLLHATLGTIALTRDAILEELSARKGPMTVSDVGNGPVTLRWPNHVGSIDA